MGHAAFVIGMLTFFTSAALVQSPASVAGVVVKFGTAEPLGGTTVELYRVVNRRNPLPGGVRPATTETGLDGRFLFQNLPPGDYRLVTSPTDGFVGAEYGQTLVEGGGTVLTLSPGQAVRDIRLTLTPTGAISGRVLDPEGEPLGRVRVQAMRVGYLPGHKQGALVIVQAVHTNDLGEYRFFWLSPGQYYISAVPEDPRDSAMAFVGIPNRTAVYAESVTPRITRRMLEDGRVQEEVHAPTYFPNTPNMAEAAAIDVHTGADLGGIDLKIAPPIPARRIRGRVIDGRTGQPAPNASVQISTAHQSPNPTILTGNTDAQGAFNIPCAVPGDYNIFISVTVPLMTTLASLKIGNADLENLTFTVVPPFDVPVNVALEGQPSGSDNVTISLLHDTKPFLARAFLDDPDVSFLPHPLTDGVFHSAALTDARAGTYRVVSGGGQPNVYIKSARFGGVDVLRDGLYLEGPPEGLLEIVLGTDVGSVAGVLLDERQDPVANIFVVLIPNAPNRPRLELHKVVSSDSLGRFRMEGIAPGDYSIFAWEDVQRWAWEDPRFLQAYERFGQVVHVGGRSIQNVTVTVIPAGLQ